MLHNFLWLLPAPVGNHSQAGAIRQQFPTRRARWPGTSPLPGAGTGKCCINLCGGTARAQSTWATRSSSCLVVGRKKWAPQWKIPPWGREPLSGSAWAREMLVDFAQVCRAGFEGPATLGPPPLSVQMQGVSLVPRPVGCEASQVLSGRRGAGEMLVKSPSVTPSLTAPYGRRLGEVGHVLWSADGVQPRRRSSLWLLRVVVNAWLGIESSFPGSPTLHHS